MASSNQCVPNNRKTGIELCLTESVTVSCRNYSDTTTPSVIAPPHA